MKPMPTSPFPGRRTMIVGHRGASGLAPENTLPAFQKALDLQVDGVEFDVQRSADGELILFHDEELDRTTNGQGNVWELTLDQLQQLDAGSWFDAGFAGTRILTLREFLTFMRDKACLLFLEIKDPFRYPGIEGEIATLIREFDLIERTQVRSFFHESLHRLHEIAPEIALSELWFSEFPEKLTYPTLNLLHLLYTPENIVQAHAKGYRATAWTVNEGDRAQELIAAGIDGLTTDFPDRLLPLT